MHRSAIPQQPVPHRRAIVLAHYDRDGLVDAHVRQALHAYRSICSRLVLVSTSLRRLPREVEGVVDDFVARSNEGYDFGSWRAGLERLGDPGDFDEVVCVNDSVYGPLWQPAAAFTDPRIAAADLWGMVLSEQPPDPPRHGSRREPRPPPQPHLQSWCFGMRTKFLRHDECRRFWADVGPQPDKQAVIARYEVGLSDRAVAAGLRVAALYDARQAGRMTFREILPHVSIRAPRRSWRHVRKARRLPHNPSELAWRRLLASGVPFVKVGLFTKNHYRLDLDVVRAGIAAAAGDYDVTLIEAHQRRLAGPAPPDRSIS